MATKAATKPTKTIFSAYFDIPKVQVAIPIAVDTFEEALIAARDISAYKLLNASDGEFTDYEKPVLSGIYKQ